MFSLGKVGTIVSIFVGITVLAGAAWKVDSRYYQGDIVVAMQKDLYQSQLQSDYNWKTYERREVRNQIWDIEDRYGTDIDDMPEGIKDKYRDLKARLNELNVEIHDLKKARDDLIKEKRIE